MNGSRLGRGRSGRLALYGGILITFVIIVYLYRAASFEMTRLHELHLQCAHQQETLANQLQVIYEYKVRLEKSLQEERNSNQALKQELQQRASREKSLRDKDKDNVEVLQRYNAVQQKYNILQSENKDLQEECKKRQKLDLEETNRLQTTLTELRSEINKAQVDKKSSLESLKNKHAKLKVDYDELLAEYHNLLQNSGNSDSKILHLEKEVFQLKRELDQKKAITSVSKPAASQNQEDNQNKGNSANEQVARPVQQPQQVSRPNNADENPQPLPAPQDHRANGDTLNEKNDGLLNDKSDDTVNEKKDGNLNEKNDGLLSNEQISDIAFAPKDGNIVPVGRNDLKEQQNMVLPLPYNVKENDSKRVKKENDNNVGEEPPSNKLPLSNEVLKKPDEKSSSSGPKLAPIQPQRNDKDQRHVESRPEFDELQDLNDKKAPTKSGKFPPANVESSTKASTASVSAEKPSLNAGKTKKKLPVGVVPIPVILDSKLDNEEKKRDEPRKNVELNQNLLAKDAVLEEGAKENSVAVEIGNLDLQGHLPAGNRHGGQIMDRQINPGWPKVQHGVQEIGDEPHHLGRLAGLDDAGHQNDLGDDQYDNEDYREQQPKNNDLRIEEEEDEAGDEDDQPDYLNNLKPEKH